jgi:geranyl-CoA carboxylase alpha subunit
VRTNRDFLIDALERPALASGKATTAFIGETYGDSGYRPEGPGPDFCSAAAVLQHAAALERMAAEALDFAPELLDWTSAGDLESIFQYDFAGSRQTMRVTARGRRAYSVRIGDQTHEIAIRLLERETAHLVIDGHGADAIWHDEDGRAIHLAIGGRSLSLTNHAAIVAARRAAAGQGTVTAPMHGKLVEISVREGASVRRGDRLAVLEAMKMQHEIVAGVDGRVASIAASAGSQIAAGSLILEIEPAGAGP